MKVVQPTKQERREARKRKREMRARRGKEVPPQAADENMAPHARFELCSSASEESGESADDDRPASSRRHRRSRSVPLNSYHQVW